MSSRSDGKLILLKARLPPDRSLELDLAALHAFQVSQRGTASRKLRVLDEHVGNVVLDGEAGTAPGADQHVSILAQGGLAHRAHQKRKELVIEHRHTSSCRNLDPW